MEARAREHVWAALILAAVLLVLLHEVLLGGRVFFDRDIHAVWASQVEVLRAALVAGSWPVWDPTVAFGHPLLANANTQVFYPLAWPNLLLAPGAAYTVYVAVHLAATAAGALLLARALGLGPAAGLLAAVLWTASGPLLSLINVWHHFAGACGLPWLLLAAERTLAAPSPRRVALLALALAQPVLAGSPDLAVYATLLLVAQALARLGQAGARRGLTAAGLAGLLALGLAAAQWVPSLAAARAAERTLTREERGLWSLHPLVLPQLAAPLSFEAVPRQSTPDAVAGLFELWAPFVGSVFLGPSTLALAMAGAVAGGRRTRWLWLSALLALLYALGRHLPLFGVLAAAGPLAVLRYPSKAMAVCALAASLLAGFGLDGLDGPAAARPRRAFLLASLTFALAPLLLALAPWLPTPALAPGALTWSAVTEGQVLSLAACGVTALGALAAAWAPFRPPVRTALIALLAAIPLLARHQDQTTAPAAFYRYRPPLVDALRAVPGARVYVWDYVLRVPGRGHDAAGLLGTFMEVPPRLEPALTRALTAQSYLYPPVAGRWNLQGSYERDLLGLYPPALRRLDVLLRAVEDTPGYLRLLQLGGVDFVVALHAEGHLGLQPAGEFALPNLHTARLFRVPQPRPQVYAVGGVRVAGPPDDEQMAVLRADFDPAREVVLEQPLPGAGSPEDLTRALAVRERRPDRLRVETNLPRAGVLVALQTHDTGWQAHLDGRPVPLLRANVAFQAVAVPAGAHQVELVYRPLSLLWGLGFSALSLAALALAAGRS